MQGTFQMMTPVGERFDATIAPFTFRAAYSVH
jgi:uncharacterized protein affecting Mg2+/Co2+ transport